MNINFFNILPYKEQLIESFSKYDIDKLRSIRSELTRENGQPKYMKGKKSGNFMVALAFAALASLLLAFYSPLLALIVFGTLSISLLFFSRQYLTFLLKIIDDRITFLNNKDRVLKTKIKACNLGMLK